MIKHIGLVRLSAIGDVILCIPAVRTLQQCYPDAKITWITSPAAYGILKNLSGIEFVVIDKPNSLKNYWAIYQQLKSYRFDVLLCMQASFRANILYPLIHATRKIGFDTARARDGHGFFIRETIPAGRDHLLDAFMRFAEALGCDKKNYTWDLNIPDVDKHWASAWIKAHISPSSKILMINPSASKQERNWLLARYIEVIQQAKQRWNLDIILTGGASVDEKNIASAIEKSVHCPIHNLVGKTTLKQLAALLSQADVLLSPDTGSLHLAVAMETPVIGLYAVAPSTLSGPYGSLNDTIDKFNDAVSLILKKNPQDIPWKTRVHTQDAMALITVDEVMDQLEKVFF